MTLLMVSMAVCFISLGLFLLAGAIGSTVNGLLAMRMAGFWPSRKPRKDKNEPVHL